MTHERPLSVAVLMELVRTPRGGGHVKCWEQFASAARTVSGLDLTVYVLGHRHEVDRVADNVRFVALPPVLGTRRLHGLIGGVDDSDLAPYHPGLARALPQHDVWHITHSLTFASTAARLGGRHRRRLTGSLHTDVPMLTSMYTQQVVAGLPAPLRSVARALAVERRAEALTRRRRDRVLRACEHLLASNPADARELASVAPQAQVSMLRRGIDRALFSPAHADRAWLSERWGVPTDEHLVLFAGRVDVTKGSPMLADAVFLLRAAGVPVHLVLAGTGAATGPITAQLGPGVTALGHLPQADLARVYASCDVLAFPSRSETAGNVVVEGMAAGLPVLLPRQGRTAQWLSSPGEDGVLVDDDRPEAWATALDRLLRDPLRRRAMGARARRTVERRVPSWTDVLQEDLLPVWQAAAVPEGSWPAVRAAVEARLPAAAQG